MSAPSSPPAPQISSRKERTRTSILDAAATCFGTHGFVGCSMEAIAEAAAVTKPTLYAHFASKEALFDTLLLETVARLKDGALPDAGSTAEVAAALLAHGKGHLCMMLAEPHLGLMRATIAEVTRRPEWAQGMMASFADDGFERWLKAADRKGLLRVPNAKAATEVYWSLVKGPLFYPVLLGFRPPAEARERNRVLKEAVRVFLAGHAV